MRRLFLGVDGGQSSTLALICDQSGRLAGWGRAGPSNHVHEPGGMARLEGALRESIGGALAAAGPTEAPIAAACLGMTGGAEWAAKLLPRIVACDRVQAEHDSVTAHAGALAGEPGAIVIAGTGSVALGVNAAGQRARAGGWAHIMGDEGSGYDLGRQALIAAARATDGRGPATTLLEAVLAHWQMATLWEVRAAVYGGRIDRPAIAGLARLVVAASAAGDEVAGRIVDRGCRELAEMVAAVLRRLDLLGQETPVAPVGGLFRAVEAVLGPFARHLATLAPRTELRAPIYPPAVGALILALRLGGVSIAEGVRRELAAAAQIVGQEK